MTAIARFSSYTFDPAGPDQSALRAEKRASWAAALRDEAGYLGELSFDTDDGRQIVIHLWDSEQAADAALASNNPRLRALIDTHFLPDDERLWSAPPVHVMGRVTTNTLATRQVDGDAP